MVNPLEVYKVSLVALRRNPMRTALTMLGVIIGVACVVAMVAIGQGASSAIQSQIGALGTNFMIVFSGSRSTGGVRHGIGSVQSLTVEDAEAIARECPSVAVAEPSVRTVAQVVYGNQNWFTTIQGAGPNYPTIRAWAVSKGSFFTEEDVKASTKVAVLGTTVVENLFGSAEANPVGEIVRIKGIPFRLIGVLDKKGGSAMGQDQDDVVLVPYTTAQKRLMGITHIQAIMVSAVSPKAIDRAADEITQLLRQRHRIGKGQDDDFVIRSQQDIASTATQMSQVLTLLLAAIASVSLLVGGIGIMNIMLVSVTERTREIGVRRALGARRADIRWQFLIESSMISGLGGVVGIGLGIFIARLISRIGGWPTLVQPQVVAAAFLFAGAVGIFFGLYPAAKAARLDPIEALRYE
ncbi:MAG: multidrug ABC transporter substrate-binding protein [Thermoanaerobaculum sp.]|nr:MAG: multidrug ABC transporter substrate-binding protein [Thermoanaerobaculum sp.]